MFQDLDATLTKVLDDAAMKAATMSPPLNELFDADKSFVTPDKNFPGTLQKPTVNLFLYEVKENRDLRDPVPIVEKTGSSFSRRLPPVRIDCSYIVTSWSNQAGGVRVVEEHRLLSQALLWLSRFPTIPSIYLQGGLTIQPFPLMTQVAQTDANKNAGEFWTALGIPPRPAFYLTVTVSLELTVAEIGPLVSTRNAQVAPGT